MVAMVEILACCVFVTPRRLANTNFHWIQERPGDEYAKLSVRVMRWHFRAPAPLEVTYVGASWATRALAERDDTAISAELSFLTGQPVRFNIFTANNERYEDALLIAEQLPRGYRGVFMVMVTDIKDDYKAKQLKRRGQIVAERSPKLEALWRRSGYRPRRTGNFFIDHLEFFAARRIAALRFGPATLGDADEQALPDQLRFEKMAKRALKDKENEKAPPPLLDTSFAVVDVMMATLAAKGALVVIIDAPDNPFREGAVPERLARYRDDTALLAAERGAEFWSFQDELDLTPADFQDHEHLGSEIARSRFEALLLDQLASVIDTRFPVGVP